MSGLDTIFKLSVVINMLDNISRPANVAGKNVTELQNKLEKMENASASMTKAGMVMTTTGAAITAAVLAPVEATVETQKALGDLRSVGIKDLNALEGAAESFSNTWSETTKSQFIASAYDIKSGIYTLTDVGVAKYTEMAGMTAKATKGNIGEMTNLFAIGYGIYKDYYKKMDDIKFGEMLSAGISSTANLFRAEGKTISDAIQNLGASATLAKRPMVEQFTVLGMLMQTMNGSEAGTKYRSFIKNAASAGKELGLSFVDNKNNLLGMTQIIDKLRGKFGETLDATEKIKIQKAFGDDEAVALIDALYTKSGDLNSNLKTMGDMMGKGIELTKGMADARNMSIGDEYEKLTNELHNASETMGKEMIPVLLPMISKTTELVKNFTAWSKENKDTLKTLMSVAFWVGVLLITFGAFNTAIGTVGFAFSNIGKGFSFTGDIIRGIPGVIETMQIKALYAGDAIQLSMAKIRAGTMMAIDSIKSIGLSILNFAKTAAINGVNAIKSFVVGIAQMAAQAVRTAVTALPGLIASVWSFTAALLANPITWVVVGIIALIAALVLLWRNWDKVSQWISGAWRAAINGVMSVANSAKGFFQKYGPTILAVLFPFLSIPLLIMKNWNVIGPFLGNLFAGIKNKFVEIVNYIKGLGTVFATAGQALWEAFTNGLKKVLLSPYDVVKDGLAKLRKLLPFSDAKEGPLSTLTKSGRALMDTLASGVQENSPALKIATSTALKGSLDTSDYAKTVKEFKSTKESNVTNRSVKKISLREVFQQSNTESKETTVKEKGAGRIFIEKLIIEAGNRSFEELMDEVATYAESC